MRASSAITRLLPAPVGKTMQAGSVFSRGDYLFKEVANTSLGKMPSDVAQMSSALGGPYWMWGAVCGATSVLILALGLWWALRTPKAKKLS